MQWIVEKAPITQSEYYGSNYALAENFIEAHFNKRPLSDIMILYGPPGVGKTSLMNVLLNKHKVKHVYCNASDSRTTEFMEQIVKQLITDTDYKIVILDEADNLPKASEQVLSKYRKEFKHPLVLICNDFYQIGQTLKSGAWEIKFEAPSNRDLTYFLEMFIKNNNIKLSEQEKNTIISNSHSFRGIVSNVQVYNDIKMYIKEPLPIYDIFDKIRKTNKGIETDLTTEELFMWTASNTKQQNLISAANILIMQSRTKTSVSDYAEKLLKYCRLPEGRLSYFYMGSQSVKKEEKVLYKEKINNKNNKNKKEEKIKKEPIKSKSISDWI
jgi:replication-associated recombination protein RarA